MKLAAKQRHALPASVESGRGKSARRTAAATTSAISAIAIDAPCDASQALRNAN